MDLWDVFRRNWTTIAHCDLILNLWVICFLFFVNEYIIFAYFCLILSFFYAYFAFNKKSSLHIRFNQFLVDLDKKSVVWARRKIRISPGNKLARFILPLSAIKLSYTLDSDSVNNKDSDIIKNKDSD